MRLLLLSNSTAPGRTYLDHAAAVLGQVLNGRRRLVFVPFALADHDGYTAKIAQTLAPLGVEVVGLHQGEPAQLLDWAHAVFVGGGNTFRLLRDIHALGLIGLIRQQVENGAVFIGSSAGTNIACPTARTTNDMPIVQPPTLEATSLIPFQINPHYLDPMPGATYMGETREQRLLEFLAENDVPVLGLREGTWLLREADTLTLGGIDAGARLFRRGHQPQEIPTNTDLSWLLSTQPHFDAAG